MVFTGIDGKGRVLLGIQICQADLGHCRVRPGENIRVIRKILFESRMDQSDI